MAPPIRIADTSTAIPGGTGNFTSFGDVSLSATDVAFLGFGATGQQGIYDMTGGSLVKVVDLNDILDGRSITGLSLSRTGLSGDPIAFQATFADGSQGIFIWSLPVAGRRLQRRRHRRCSRLHGVAQRTRYDLHSSRLRRLAHRHFGQSAAANGSGSIANAAVPEPATLVLLMVAAAGWCLRRGRTA